MPRLQGIRNDICSQDKVIEFLGVNDVEINWQIVGNVAGGTASDS